jgi:hypothetical protein
MMRLELSLFLKKFKNKPLTIYERSSIVKVQLRSLSTKENMHQVYPHFVFGYGSLICPTSRAITAPTVAGRAAVPVTVKNIERTWAKRSDRGMTSMNIRFREGAECVGVLVPVDHIELSQFDEREVGYDRIELQPCDVVQVTFLGDSYYENTFLDVEVAGVDPPHIWVYVQYNPFPATTCFPIVQTYVDVILRGCLTVSEEFAHEFIATTRGWDPAELSDYVSSSDEEGSSDKETDDVVWLDDRNDPIYVRADPEYSLKKALELDRLLRKHHPHELRNRRRRAV